MNAKRFAKYIGRPFEVAFLDHSENVGQPVPCTAYGILAAVNRDHVVLRAWSHAAGIDGITEWALLISTIKGMWLLERADQPVHAKRQVKLSNPLNKVSPSGETQPASE